MFDFCLGAQCSVFLCFERIGKQLSKLNNRLLFISRESGTSKSCYCAYFEALVCMHKEQTDEVHFTVRL